MATMPPPALPSDLDAILQAVTKAVQANPNVSVTTDIGAVANMITESLKFFQTTQGQGVIEDWRKGASQFNADIAAAWAKFEALFK